MITNRAVGTLVRAGTDAGDGRPVADSAANPVRPAQSVSGTYWGASDLTSNDLRAVLTYAEQIATLTDAAAVNRMLDGLATVVGADGASLSRIDLRSGQEIAVVWPESRVDPDVLTGYAAVSGTHPLRPLLADQARIVETAAAPLRISDVRSLRQWRSSALYSASHRGIDDQLCVLIGGRGATIQILVLTRYRGLFTDRQAAVLGAARAHVMAAVRRIGAQTRPHLQLAPHLRWLTAPVGIPIVSPPGITVGGSHLPGGEPVRSAVGAAMRTTARQRQILAHAAEGLTDAQIGRRLGLSATTVSKHLSRAYSRLGVPNRAAAVKLLLGDVNPSLQPSALSTVK